MKLFLNIIVGLLLVALNSVYAQSSVLSNQQGSDMGAVEVKIDTYYHYTFSVDDMVYKLRFITPSIVRVLSYPENSDVVKTQRLVVDLDNFKSYKPELSQTSEELSFKSDVLTLLFDKKEKRFRFVDRLNGKDILRELGANKSRSFHRENIANEDAYGIIHQFESSPQEALYGLGQYQDGKYNFKNDTILLLQSNKDIVNPLLLSSLGYGILWDNYSSTKFVDSGESFQFESEVSDASDYYFLYGETLDGIVNEYRTLTGRVPMFGKWAYGFWQSKERYKSFDEVESVVKEYRKRKIPIDNIVQDWEYWGDKSHWNSLKFDPNTFPNPESAISRIKSKYNVHYMLSVWPGFGPETAIYEEFDSINALFDEKTWAGYKIFDAYNPKARDIFWRYFKSGLYDKGVDGWWLDATEPSFRDGFTQLKQEERSKSAGKTYLGSFHRYLNVYSLELTRFIHDKLRSENDQKRVFILTRSAFASQQKYGAAVWSGDVSASWANFEKQIPAGLNLSMSGIPYWTSDIGGFFVTERGGEFPMGLEDDEYKELYSRWFQFVTFCPIFRAHGTNVPREVWQFGEKGEPYYDNQVKYIELRYKLLPYIYSLAYDVYANNFSMMRSMAMAFEEDSKTKDISNSYMFGSSFLIHPVTSTIKNSATTDTYLPEHDGKYWYNFWNSESIKGGQVHTMETPLDIVPLYVKGGSIVPMGKVQQFAMESPTDALEINLYSGKDAEFQYYDDEGDSYNYEKGTYSLINMSWNEANRTLTFSNREGSYKGMPKQIKLEIALYEPNQATPKIKKVVYKGSELKVNY